MAKSTDFQRCAVPRGTVAHGFVIGMLAGAQMRGHDRVTLLRRAGIQPGILTREARLQLTDYARLYNHVVDALQDEGFALFTVPLRPGMFEFLCHSMVGSRDLAEAFVRMAGYLRVVLPDLRMEVSTVGFDIHETSSIWVARDDPRRVFAFEWLLRLIHALACWLVGRTLPLEEVHFPYDRPSHAADYTLIYTERAHFGGAHMIVRLHSALMHTSVIRDSGSVATFLEGTPGKIAMLYRGDHEIAQDIRQILAAALPDQLSLSDVAKRLGLTLRTIQRRLLAEGVTFRNIKDGLRRTMALDLVEKSDRAIADIATDLGYAECSAFYRAFIHWTGKAPTAHRKKVRAL